MQGLRVGYYYRVSPKLGWQRCHYIGPQCRSGSSRRHRSLLRSSRLASTVLPTTAAALGLDLKRIVIVRPTTLADRLWAIDQALRSPSIVAVIAEIEQLDDHAARRLQLAAESGGSLGFLVRSSQRQQPSWAEVQWLVRPMARAVTHPRRPRSLRCHIANCSWNCSASAVAKAAPDCTFKSTPPTVGLSPPPQPQLWLARSHAPVKSLLKIRRCRHRRRPAGERKTEASAASATLKNEPIDCGFGPSMPCGQSLDGEPGLAPFGSGDLVQIALCGHSVESVDEPLYCPSTQIFP